MSVRCEDTEEVQEITRARNFKCKPLQPKNDKLFTLTVGANCILCGYFTEIKKTFRLFRRTRSANLCCQSTCMYIHLFQLTGLKICGVHSPRMIPGSGKDLVPQFVCRTSSHGPLSTILGLSMGSLSTKSRRRSLYSHQNPSGFKYHVGTKPTLAVAPLQVYRQHLVANHPRGMPGPQSVYI